MYMRKILICNKRCFLRESLRAKLATSQCGPACLSPLIPGRILDTKRLDDSSDVSRHAIFIAV